MEILPTWKEARRRVWEPKVRGALWLQHRTSSSSYPQAGGPRLRLTTFLYLNFPNQFKEFQQSPPGQSSWLLAEFVDLWGPDIPTQRFCLWNFLDLHISNISTFFRGNSSDGWTDSWHCPCVIARGTGIRCSVVRSRHPVVPEQRYQTLCGASGSNIFVGFSLVSLCREETDVSSLFSTHFFSTFFSSLNRLYCVWEEAELWMSAAQSKLLHVSFIYHVD